ncbi:S8 family peptidase [Bradyrhizobium sp. 27S5]|uniref:S8 family peptidase n=1 Tax=Bradyrhizobium sp. 27S5 TaxID=3139728 RepID=UPI0030CB9A91
MIRNLLASPEELQRVVQGSAAIVELRSASSFVADFFDLMPEQKAKTVEEIASRVLPAWPAAPRVTMLDTGVNRAHTLLERSLPADKCYTVEPAWGTTDKQGHGTKMAGLALYGDLSDVAQSTLPVVLQANLESVVVTAPQAPGDIPARDAMQRAVEIVEKEPHPRIFCLAQTAQGEADDGRPTSTSAVLDKLAYGDGVTTRLFCAAVGNVRRTATEPYLVADYADRNAAYGIESPAQALNALSVGAVSLKEHGNTLLAPAGDLMPTSRTAASWPGSHASKPDIVMEGGNFYVDDPGLYAQPSPDHLVMTTSRDAPANPLAMCCETSAATALVSGLGARLMNRYPSYRMETVRGLIVHSAEWTPIMIEHQKALVRFGLSELDAWRAILDRFGWGVPNEQRLFSSASNALTLIAEDELHPYERQTKGGVLQPVRLREMKYFRLPWPVDVLRSLGSTQTEMRCTLSYFVEPDPHAASRDRANERYASHRLKMDVKRFGEGHGRAQSRFNIFAPDDGPSAGPLPAQDDGWLLSGFIQRGTLVQDIWRGPAYRLAERDGISVAPIRGWWGDLTELDNYERPVRFSLIVSIRTPEASGDLMVDVGNRITAGILVDGAPVPVST